MSRSISIDYEEAASGRSVSIDIPAPYFLLGTQQSSMSFWSIPRLKEIGIARLTQLGEFDPVNFWGWDDLAVLGLEIDMLAKHLESVDFNPEIKTRWLSHLTYCYHLLIETAPKDSKPVFSIG